MSGNRAPAASVYVVMDLLADVDVAENEPLPIELPDPVLDVIRDYGAFYRSSYQSVANALSFTLGDRELAHEATDEAMARAYQRWDHVASFESPAGWTYRVGLNWARSVLRRKRRVELVVLTDDHVHDGSVGTDHSLEAALAALPIAQRSVVVCRFYLDWSVEQTATALHLRPGTVKSRLHRGLAALQTILKSTEQS